MKYEIFLGSGPYPVEWDLEQGHRHGVPGGGLDAAEVEIVIVRSVKLAVPSHAISEVVRQRRQRRRRHRRRPQGRRPGEVALQFEHLPTHVVRPGPGPAPPPGGVGVGVGVIVVGRADGGG